MENFIKKKKKLSNEPNEFSFSKLTKSQFTLKSIFLDAFSTKVHSVLLVP